MTGLILAAGAGTRLNGHDAVRPKCALPFAGTPLIEYQLRSLRACGIDDIAVVVGFEAERVRRLCGRGVRFVENAEYGRTNSLYSLWLARPLLMDGFVVLNCDVLFHPVLLADLLTAHHDDALLVSYPRASDPPFGDEEMKAHVRRGQIVDLRKDLPAHLTDGENVGIARFSAAGAARLVPLMERRLADGRRDWAPRAFADFARERPLHAIGTRGLPWTEIDTPEDYQHASAVVYPAIKAAMDELTPALQKGSLMFTVPTPPPIALGGRMISPLPQKLRIVALGGGTGLPNVLRGLCSLLYAGSTRQQPGEAGPDQLVAVVTTTDDGGSSGRLRRDFGVIPPGDIRNCLAAMAEDQSLLTAVFQYRFEGSEGLNGHALGNLMLTALTEVTGDFVKAVDIAARVVGARGRVIPASVDHVSLSAQLTDGRTVAGETAIVAAASPIQRLSLEPAEPRCVDTALDALRRADVIVVGPGSLYTSLLPPLLMPEILEAVRLAEAARVLVLNLMTEPGETGDFDAVRHLEVIQEHLGFQPFDHVIFNTAPIPEHLGAWYAERGAAPIVVTAADIVRFRALGVQPLGAPLASEGPLGRVRHHPGRLAATVLAAARLAPRQPLPFREGSH